MTDKDFRKLLRYFIRHDYPILDDLPDDERRKEIRWQIDNLRKYGTHSIFNAAYKASISGYFPEIEELYNQQIEYEKL